MNIHIYPDLASIAAPFEAILLDAYGVFWSGNAKGLIPGAKEALKNLVSMRKCVGILSNSTQLAAAEQEKLAQHGLIQGQHYHFLFTSGQAAKEHFYEDKLPFATTKKKYYLSSKPHPRFSPPTALFQDSPYQEAATPEDADFIYLSVPHLKGVDQTDPNQFRLEAAALASTGLPIICANPDHFAHEGNPPQAFARQGSIAALLEEYGCSVYYIGKPAPYVYHKAIELFAKYRSIDSHEILMVGDTPETDIRGANRCGMSTALILQTGIMGDRISHQGMDQAIGQLSKADTPTFYIQKLGQ